MKCIIQLFDCEFCKSNLPKVHSLTSILSLCYINRAYHMGLNILSMNNETI
jgi:hypothetical protein